MVRLYGDDTTATYKVVHERNWATWDDLRKRAEEMNTPVISYTIPMKRYTDWERALLRETTKRDFRIDLSALMDRTVYDACGNIIDDGYLRVPETIRAIERYAPNELFGSNEDLNGELDNFFNEFGGDG